MSGMRTVCIAIACMMFFNVVTAGASIPAVQQDNKRVRYATDDMLKKIAVEKGIIPEDAGEAFFKAAIKKKDTIAIWILMDNKTRTSIIDNFREINKKDGVIVKLPSEYYVREITSDIYNSIVKGDVVVLELANIFKTLAIMEGDYDNGKDKVAVAKEYMGEDGFQMYKKMYPEKYEKLIKK